MLLLQLIAACCSCGAPACVVAVTASHATAPAFAQQTCCVYPWGRLVYAGGSGDSRLLTYVSESTWVKGWAVGTCPAGVNADRSVRIVPGVSGFLSGAKPVLSSSFVLHLHLRLDHLLMIAASVRHSAQAVVFLCVLSPPPNHWGCVCVYVCACGRGLLIGWLTQHYRASAATATQRCALPATALCADGCRVTSWGAFACS